MKTDAEPTSWLLAGAPINAVLPSELSATLEPNAAAPISLWAPLVGANSVCWLIQVVPPRLKTKAEPTLSLFRGAPTSAVLPSELSATLEPNKAAPISLSAPLVGANSVCWLIQVLLPRMNTNAAPMLPSLPGAPTSAVLASADRAALAPNWALALAPLPGVSF